MLLKPLLFIAFLCAAPLAADELPAPVKKAAPQMEEVGKARLSMLFFDVYDIALYGPEGVWREDKPQAISIRYLLSIDGEDIATRSRDEMERQNIPKEKLDAWNDAMRKVFPNVEKGTVLSAWNRPQKETVFYKDGVMIGKIDDPAFGPAFFGIWTRDDTSEPELRAQLIGGS